MRSEHDVDAIFLAAAEIEAADKRNAYLDEACGSDDVCRAQVEKLLAAHEQAGSFMRLGHTGSTVDAPTPNIVGSTIGPYKLLQRIGEGGMGVVYMAEQSKPVRRRVALKIIKPGMDSQSVLARFEAERQALAMMDHPNIAKVLEVGKTEDRPYFVMELVKGIPITQYCDGQRLTIRDRLELFLPICRAVQHAHQKGIIHRDLKPSNVLVAHYDDHPVVKVIDFGVAKAINQQLTEKTMFTQYGQIVGTIEYMSPEQARFNQLDVDTRSDVYSLGVLLYELLTGDTPFDKHRLRTAAMDELIRIIREEEPPIPSTRLSSGRVQPNVAVNRKTERRKLSGQIRGELDWIVMKALEKERSRRYETASGLAADLERYLKDEPVEACPPSMGYQLSKLIRRHKTTAVVVMAVSLSLVIGTVVASLGFLDAKRQAARADWVSYLNRIALANQNLKSNRPSDAKKLLQACPDGLRSWEWDVLHGQCYAKQSQLPSVADDVCSLSIARNGERVALGLDEGTIFIWDRLTGQQRRIVAYSESTGWMLPNWIDLSPDGSTVAAASDGNTVKLWNATTGDRRATLQHDSEVTGLAFSNDARRLVAVGDGGSVTIWDLTTDKVFTTFKTPVVWLWAAQFSPDGRSVAVGGTNGDLFIYDVEAQDVQHFEDHVAPINGISFHPNGNVLATASIDNSIKLLDIGKGRVLHTFVGHTGEVGAVAFHPHEPRLASVSHDGTVRVWDTNTGEQVVILGEHGDAIRGAEFSGDGRQLITAGYDRGVTIWDATRVSAQQVIKSRILHQFDSRVLALAVAKDGTWLAAGGEDGAIMIWSLVENQLNDVIYKHGKRRVVFDITSTNDSRIVSAGAAPEPDSKGWHRIFAWNPLAPTQPNHFEIPNSRESFCVAVSLDDRFVVYGGKTKRLIVHRSGTNVTHDTVLGFHKYGIMNLTFSPSGKYLASVDEQRIVKLWNADGEHLREQQQGDDLFDGRGVSSSNHARPAFHPTNDELLLVVDGNELVELSLPSGTEVSRFPRGTGVGHGNTVNSAIYSPSGQIIASGGNDSTLRIWDAASGALLRTLLDDGPVNDVVFVAENQLASSGEDGAVKIWDLSSLRPK